MKDFAKSIRTMNSNKEEIIKNKKEQGATLKVDNGQKLEFSDGTTYVKTSFSDDYREAKNYTGNAKVCNEAIVLKDGDVWVVLYANETKSKEFDTEAEARKFAKKVGNSKVGNREISLSASNSGELNLYDDGTGSMYDPVELGRYDFKGKSDAMATVRELEKLKREAEAKVKDCQRFIDALKQWANGLK